MRTILILAICFLMLPVFAWGVSEYFTLINLDNASTGTGSVVTPYKAWNNYTCDVVLTDNYTAVGYRIAGNTGWGTVKFDNSSTGILKEGTCSNTTDNVCTFHISNKPVVNMRAKIDNSTGAGLRNVKIYCIGN